MSAVLLEVSVIVKYSSLSSSIVFIFMVSQWINKSKSRFRFSMLMGIISIDAFTKPIIFISPPWNSEKFTKKSSPYVRVKNHERNPFLSLGMHAWIALPLNDANSIKHQDNNCPDNSDQCNNNDDTDNDHQKPPFFASHHTSPLHPPNRHNRYPPSRSAHSTHPSRIASLVWLLSC